MAKPEDDQIHPVVNVEEVIGKTVGKRLASPIGRAQKIGQAIYKRRGFGVCTKGVYRFHSHEEADEWLWTMITRRPRS